MGVQVTDHQLGIIKDNAYHEAYDDLKEEFEGSVKKDFRQFLKDKMKMNFWMRTET